MKDYIKIGIEKNLISFNEDMSRITYVFQNKECESAVGFLIQKLKINKCK